MPAKRKIQIFVDFAMTALLPLLMAYSMIGEMVHEWLGATMLVLFVVHHVLNFRWFKFFVKGKYTLVRIFNAIVNLLLLADMLCLAISGIVLSRYVFSFLPIEGGASFARRLHMLGSYWGLALMSVHIGMHWTMVLRMFCKATALPPSGRRKVVIQVCCLTVSVYGVYAFITRQILDYMMLKIQFVFFDFNETLFLFLLDYLAIIILFAVVGYYLSKLFARKGHRKG